MVCTKSGTFKLGTNHPWKKGIQNAKIGWSYLKIFFSRTTVRALKSQIYMKAS
jgi:hypothetical protein